MTEQEWAILRKYVTDRAEEIGLRDWIILRMYEKPEDVGPAMAVTQSVDGRRMAQLWVSDEFRSQSPEDQRNTIIHELLHMGQFPFHDLIRLGLPRHLGQQAYDVLWFAYRNAVEMYTDTLATAIAEKFPLIEWGMDA